MLRSSFEVHEILNHFNKSWVFSTYLYKSPRDQIARKSVTAVMTHADMDRQETGERTNSLITFSYEDSAFMAIQCRRQQ